MRERPAPPLAVPVAVATATTAISGVVGLGGRLFRCRFSGHRLGGLRLLIRWLGRRRRIVVPVTVRARVPVPVALAVARNVVLVRRVNIHGRRLGHWGGGGSRRGNRCG